MASILLPWRYGTRTSDMIPCLQICDIQLFNEISRAPPAPSLITQQGNTSIRVVPFPVTRHVKHFSTPSILALHITSLDAWTRLERQEPLYDIVSHDGVQVCHAANIPWVDIGLRLEYNVFASIATCDFSHDVWFFSAGMA